MPSAARLIAALCMGCTAFLLSLAMVSLMPPSTDFGYFIPVNIAIGAACGWMVIGRRTGGGLNAAVNNGLGAALCLVFWGLFIHSGALMFERSLASWYGSAGDAIAAMLEMMIKFGWIMVDPSIGFIFGVGGVASGVIAEYVWRKWP